MNKPTVKLSPTAQAAAAPSRGPASIELRDDGYVALTPPNSDHHYLPDYTTDEDLRLWQTAPTVRIKAFTPDRFVDLRSLAKGVATLELSAYDAAQLRDFLCAHFGPPTPHDQGASK